MTTTQEQQAPGCFAAASVYGSDSVVCQACPAFSACGEASVKRLQEIRELVDVSDLLKRHAAARQKAINTQMEMMQALRPPARTAPVAPSPIPVAQPKPVKEPIERKTTVAKVTFEPSPADQAALDAIASKVKVHEQALVLVKGNKFNEMRAMLPKGENPFAVRGPKYLRIACDMLTNGGFTKASLKARLVADLEWTDGTAASHVTIAVMLLYAFGIAAQDQETAGGFVLNPALG